ncbi:hypothetical protein COCMIDRAFT_25252 [Bipolaris oryzae ATCC 44560]|uniref:Uncharacterized protein n=1 Tax=Bipolaris oryzae ATCC 44560 TaxID=930090 RepID=W6ZAF8_COCMI|nr:uncharacterized protein COCMIDRAFT_25252 [Bipolaris oryzae ATCC 44560]EUC46778.1 hypothetical protein COCMIDRAFT_25252 [Bipolaris oryzae ATCC 44560]
MSSPAVAVAVAFPAACALSPWKKEEYDAGLFLAATACHRLDSPFPRLSHLTSLLVVCGERVAVQSATSTVYQAYKLLAASTDGRTDGRRACATSLQHSTGSHAHVLYSRAQQDWTGAVSSREEQASWFGAHACFDANSLEVWASWHRRCQPPMCPVGSGNRRRNFLDSASQASYRLSSSTRSNHAWSASLRDATCNMHRQISGFVCLADASPDCSSRCNHPR